VVGRQSADIADTLHLRTLLWQPLFWHWMGYNFGCMIASDTLPRVGFLGSCYPMNTANFEVLRDVAVATIFWLSIYGVHIGTTWRI